MSRLWALVRPGLAVDPGTPEGAVLLQDSFTGTTGSAVSTSTYPLGMTPTNASVLFQDNRMRLRTGTSTSRRVSRRVAVLDSKADFDIRFTYGYDAAPDYPARFYARSTRQAIDTYDGYWLWLGADGRVALYRGPTSEPYTGVQLGEVNIGGAVTAVRSVRFWLVGRRLRVKTWLTGSAEPAAWAFDIYDVSANAITAGGYSGWTVDSTASTQTNLYIDDLLLKEAIADSTTPTPTEPDPTPTDPNEPPAGRVLLQDAFGGKTSGTTLDTTAYPLGFTSTDGSIQYVSDAVRLTTGSATSSRRVSRRIAAAEGIADLEIRARIWWPTSNHPYYPGFVIRSTQSSMQTRDGLALSMRPTGLCYLTSTPASKPYDGALMVDMKDIAAGSKPPDHTGTTKPYKLRWHVVGQRNRVKVWDAAVTEPSAWQLDFTITDPTYKITAGGAVGFYVDASAQGQNWFFDDLTVLTAVSG